MELVVCWALFPALLTVLAAGCGAAVNTACGWRSPAALLPAVGFAAIAVVGQFVILADATAELATPVVLALAAAGLVALWARRRRPSGWGVAAAAGAFAVYAAPIVASGEATFAGYIRLDDTATWMALTDRVMEHGRSLEGLAPSTYEATLAFNLGDGYPVGVFVPLGVGRELVGQDVAWLIQPYMAWLAAVLALALWSLVRPLLGSARWAALAACVAAQPALLYGYFLWGGVKEVAAALLLAALAASIAPFVAGAWSWRAAAIPAVLAAALAGVLSAGGLLWLAPGLAVAGVLALRWLPSHVLAARALGVVALVAVLSVPVLATGGAVPPTSSPLTDADARGNLLGALEPAQVAGIWPAGDFRLDPDTERVTYALIALVLLAAAAGATLSWRRRRWASLAYFAGVPAGGALIWSFGSPWVDAKALATASPAVLLAAMAGALALIAGARRPGLRIAGGALAALVIAGVVWSNALAYRDVNLAPRDQLAELESIGEQIAGEGPTLMTEYQPYGARHFLREADPEAASELRRRQVPLRGGATLSKGEWVDTDELDPGSLLIYRTLVLRRSPVQSRPPAAYELISAGAYYDVWQRAPGPAPQVRRLGLGTRRTPVGRPSCRQVMLLAGRADPGQSLVAARRPAPVAVSLARSRYPARWRLPGTAAHPQPRGGGTLELPVVVPTPGEYEIWLRGSVRPEVDLLIDGKRAGQVRHELNNAGQYVRLGEASLARGSHELALEFAGADLHPGSGGAPATIGPLMLSAGEAADARIVRVEPDAARRLCGRAWEWIELGG